MDRLTSIGLVRKLSAASYSVDAILSTSAVARDGAIILASAWRLSNFRKNPIVLVGHDTSAPPVGRASDVRVVGQELRATITFDHRDTAAMAVWNKIEDGFYNGVSVRWNPIAWETRRIAGKDVLVFTDVDLLEVSVVTLPSDPHAVVIRHESGELVTARSLEMTTARNGNHPVLTPAPSVAATDRMRSRFERAWTEPDQPLAEVRETLRANFELAGILLGGADATSRAVAGNGANWGSYTPASEDFRAAWRAVVLADAPEVAARERAMDAQETGYGLQLVGTGFEDALWRGARSRDLLLDSIPTVRAAKGGHTIATDGALPEMLFVPENTAAGASAYATSKMATAGKNADAAKFTVQTMFSGELREDSIVSFVPMLRASLTESFRKHMASAYYNGDTTNAGTGNINSDDGDPADTKHYLAFDGIRHAFLVDATGQGINAAAGVTIDHIEALRLLLSGDVTDDPDALSTLDWGAEPSDLLIICDRYSYRDLSALSGFTPMERIARNDVRAGELGRIGGIRIYAPSYAVRTEADGKASTTPASNTKGQLSMINVKGWRGVSTGGVRFYLDRVQGTDQYLLELFTRQQLHRYSDTVTAGLFNVTV